MEVIDVENYQDLSDKSFSHSALVMSCLRKCTDLGSREMREGWFNEKIDKNGLIIKTRVDDTRKAFISSVKIAMAIMKPDMDDSAKENIKKIKEELKNEFKRLDDEEDEEFNGLSPILQHQRIVSGIIPVKNSLNRELPYYNMFIDIEYDTYLNILGELSDLTARKDYFKAEMLEN